MVNIQNLAFQLVSHHISKSSRNLQTTNKSSVIKSLPAVFLNESMMMNGNTERWCKNRPVQFVSICCPHTRCCSAEIGPLQYFHSKHWYLELCFFECVKSSLSSSPCSQWGSKPHVPINPYLWCYDPALTPSLGLHLDFTWQPLVNKGGAESSNRKVPISNLQFKILSLNCRAKHHKVECA